MNFLSGIRTHLIRDSDDSSFMFVVFGFDLIIKVWFLWIVLTLDFLGFSWLCSWSFFVVTPYLSFCICHLPKRHMMSTHVWTSSAFVFIIVWVWHFYPLVFVFLYSDENKQTKEGIFVTLRIMLNVDGAPISSRSHTHPSHTQNSRLLTSSLSLGVPGPHTTQCM